MMRQVSLWDRLLEMSGGPRTRVVVGTLYIMLAFLAVLQIANPGAAERIGAETTGRGLFGMLAAVLGLAATLGIAALAFRERRAVPEAGVADVLLHLALAGLALELALSNPPFSAHATAIGFASMGAGLVYAGLHRLLRSVFSATAEGWAQRRLQEVARRDDYTRGAAFAVLGAISIIGALGHAPMSFSRDLWSTGLLAAGALALLAYGAHALWMVREQGRLWAL